MSRPMDALWGEQRPALRDPGDDYVTVEATFRALRPNSFFIANPLPGSAGEIPIPRSLIHGADDRALDGRFAGEKIAFRLRAWKARELGL